MKGERIIRKFLLMLLVLAMPFKGVFAAAVEFDSIITEYRNGNFKKALGVVKEAISEDRDPMELKELLTSDAVKEMKADVRKDKIDKDSIAERRQQQHRHRAKDKLEKIDGLKDEDGGKHRK